MLVRLIYRSDESKALDLSAVEAIARSAAKNNKPISVSGMLFYNHRQFIQVLEGNRSKVNKLFQTISRDERHDNVEVLQFTEVSRRHFYHWHMHYIGEGVINRKLALKYGIEEEFDFSQMVGESAFELLKEIAEQEFEMIS